MNTYLRWDGAMQPMGVWARPEGTSVGLIGEEFYFVGFRVDIGRDLTRVDRWSLRAEAGLELLVIPTSYRGFAIRATVNGQELPDATVILTAINDADRPVGRARLALLGAYTDRRWNKWNFAVAAQMSLSKDVIQGAYRVESPTGRESGTFSGQLNALEVAVGRTFSWGKPKLPRWAVQEKSM